MSGDSDYVELVTHLRGEGVRVEIAAVRNSTAQILIDKSDNCEFFLYKYKFSNKNKNKILFLLNKYEEINIEELLDEQQFEKLMGDVVSSSRYLESTKTFH